MALSAPTLVAAARCAAAIPTLYSIMSVNEYITHRYYQHEEFNKEPFLQNIWCKLRGIEKPPKVGTPNKLAASHKLSITLLLLYLPLDTQ